MTPVANTLKNEIARIARKEMREEITSLRKASSSQRTAIAALKKEVKSLEGQLKQLGRNLRRASSQAPGLKTGTEGKPEASGKPGRKVTFTADRLKASRARLGFTQQQMAQLLGVSSLSIWKWESGSAAPRASRVPRILERLVLGKRAALAAIEE